MFPKGPRFAPPKIPDVPGPNHYNLPQESQLDAYKRGAFLEKTDRFNKDKPSDVPGPGTYTTDIPAKPGPGHGSRPASQAANTTMLDRYATLQRKLDDLERVHVEGKKSSQAEIDRLKADLMRLQKTNGEQADRLEKQKSAHSALDVRVQELKKSALTDQAEIKDLRVKLRMAEHERAQLAGKQGEAGEAKKAAQAAESKRREEVKEREKKIADLEKALAGEKRKREAVEARLEEIKEKTEGQARVLEDQHQAQVEQLKAESLQAQATANSLQESYEDVLHCLEQHRILIARVAEEYGRLASSTVSCSLHSQLKHENAGLQLHVLRLERRLANAEGQVLELAHLIRSTKEQNADLRGRLSDAGDEARASAQALEVQTAGGTPLPEELDRLFKDAADIEIEELAAHAQLRELRMQELELLSAFYRLTCEDLMCLCIIADHTWRLDVRLAGQYSAELTEIQSSRDDLQGRLQTLTEAHDDAQTQLATMAVALGGLEEVKKELAEAKEQSKEAIAEKEEAARKERLAVQRLSGTVQRSRILEEGLRAEIDQLTMELGEGYQEAYYMLCEEVEGLLARNALAEEEANRLSKFNAEILGHKNPAQRIMYVDRIRRDLAETRQKLLVVARDKEAVVAGNEELRQELDMYKSVMIPIDCKPRTAITRVERVPLGTQSLNEMIGRGAAKGREIAVEVANGEMTLDEIM